MILLLVFILGLFLIFIAMQLIFRLFIYLLKTLPYFFMGKNAGFKYPWVAFVPAGRQYIAMTIPHCQYNLGLFKTDNRKMVYWIWLGFEAVFTILYTIATFAFYYVEIYYAGTPGYSDYYTSYGASSSGLTSEFSTVTLITQIILYAILFLRWAIRGVIQWRMYYDLLNAYEMNTHAKWAPAVNIICPLVMLVFAYIIMSRSPEYGSDGYYPLEDEEEECYEEDEYDTY